jgi:hypothetical protein
MVNYPTILKLPQEDINRQLYEMIVKAEKGDATAIKALQDAIGSESAANTILKRIKDIEGAIGTETTADTILKRIKDIETAIGAENKSGTILYRIKALEDG